MDHTINTSFNECNPWQTGLITNINILNKLKQNLVKYQKKYNKSLTQQKPRVPKIKLIGFSQKKKLTNNESKFTPQLQYTYKQLRLNRSISQPKKLNPIASRKMFCPTACQKNQFANFISVKNSNDQGVKKYQINFDQQNKYKRLRKRQIHRMIFGWRRNSPTQNQEILQYRDF